MAIQADTNLYPGINAHLNSFLQNEPGGWRNFHAEHITDIAREIDQHLPPGYFTRSEKSLQIGEFDPGCGSQGSTRTTPDITVYRQPSQRAATAAAAEASDTPVITIPLAQTLTEEDDLTGLIIYQAGEGSALGRPITRVELLSPANMPGGSHYEQYMVKRWDTLRSGLRLVEIDYLHQTPPIIPQLLDYSHRVEGALPYVILVSDPRPTFDQGKTDVYAFSVDDALPVINIPLAGADGVKISFGTVYNRTFESSRFFRMIVDYAQLPTAFDRYSSSDQARIQKRLADIQKNAGESPS